MESEDSNLRALFATQPMRDIPGEEDEPGYAGAKPNLAITFIDVAGNPFTFAYNYLYRITVESGTLVIEFSEHRVYVDGLKLAEPVRDSLLRRIAQHKVEFVEVRTRSEFGNGVVVTGVRVEAKK